MTEGLPQVSVVVPAYNAAKTIRPLLDSLNRLDYPNYEIIVVNDGSTDGTQSIVEEYPVTLVNQSNRGASAARDAGLRAAGGEVVAYADSDVIVSRDWLSHLVAPYSDPGVAATTGQTIFLRSSKCTSWFRSLDIERRYARRSRYTKLANGPNCAFRRRVLLELGGFDPSWYHAEDTEISYRIGRAGHRIEYVPEALAYHVPEEDWRVFLRKRYRDARAFTRVLRRYPRSALIEDDFLDTRMKVQPPLFLVLMVLSPLAILFAQTAIGIPVLILAIGVGLAGVALNLHEAISASVSSGKRTFLFRGIALGLLRGFAWGAGLALGSLRMATRRST